MLVFYRNFLRNKMLNLSIRSLKHFLPNAKVVVCSFYEHSESEYDNQPHLVGVDFSFFKETKFKKDNNRPLDFDGITSGFGHPMNASFFSEGFNIAMEMFGSYEEKILLLNEDHYFTTGETLRLLTSNDYTISYANWDSQTSVNASIVSFIPSKVNHLFPISEVSKSMVEQHFYTNLVAHVPAEERLLIPTRYHIDYKGDGSYCNSSALIEQDLAKAGII